MEMWKLAIRNTLTMITVIIKKGKEDEAPQIDLTRIEGTKMWLSYEDCYFSTQHEHLSYAGKCLPLAENYRQATFSSAFHPSRQFFVTAPSTFKALQAADRVSLIWAAPIYLGKWMALSRAFTGATMLNCEQQEQRIVRLRVAAKSAHRIRAFFSFLYYIAISPCCPLFLFFTPQLECVKLSNVFRP
jgi:hypothetical protein